VSCSGSSSSSSSSSRRRSGSGSNGVTEGHPRTLAESLPHLECVATLH